MLKRNHQNALSYSSGALILFRNQTYFNEGNYGSCLRETTYKPLSVGVPFTFCLLGQQISISLMQKYLLNTLTIWLWNYDYIVNWSDRYYNIIVYTKLNGGFNKIYDSNLAQGIITIEFSEQFVEEFRVFNRGGNTHNSLLHIIKVQAYYKFS